MPGRKISFKSTRTRNGFNWFLKRKKTITGKPMIELSDRSMDLESVSLSVKRIGKGRVYKAKNYDKFRAGFEKHERGHVRQLIFHSEHGFPLKSNSVLAYIEEFGFVQYNYEQLTQQAFDKIRKRIIDTIDSAKQRGIYFPKNLGRFKKHYLNPAKEINLKTISIFTDYLYLHFNSSKQLFKGFLSLMKNERMRHILETFNNIPDSKLNYCGLKPTGSDF